MTKPVIVLTNDDGIHSPGLHAAVEAMLPFGRLIVVAPTRQQTAMGRSFWGDQKEFFHPIDFQAGDTQIEAYHCDCSPALIVEHAMNTLFLNAPPDLLLSGINYGENLGTDTTLSGTVGAALQAADMKIPALAVSLQTDFSYHFSYGEVDWSAAKHFLAHFASYMLEQPLPGEVDVLKVDVPQDASPETAWRITRLARHMHFSTYVKNPSQSSPISDTELCADLNESELSTDSDIYALMVDKVVSVTPLTLDMTSRIDLKDLEQSIRHTQ
ncbi:stationary-phase survival protein SurE [candidate division KSB3 bacterium]|uniref:5'-nucleotidase n=1 Tax=candidate division KSB3 bacterium TaxID=2044937 RepID=A0A2G6E7E7_9BACT|nr:MAG: stationary-phase survival protein SurE [candidate division KSB3 bacterium]PIE30393.1 MAG: stationary-phase survival protein SurE [candidate division KSB3 bacterium]